MHLLFCKHSSGYEIKLFVVVVVFTSSFMVFAC